jgi:lipoate-protein ligase A
MTFVTINDKPIWRLIISTPGTGAWNMAMDEAILESATHKTSPPTLRFYAWSPPCISLGYAQPISNIDLERIQALKWDIVRRPSGGRAILHTDELTYSIAAPLDDPHFSGGVLESYRHISQGLVEGLRLLHLEIEVQTEVQLTSTEREQAICFEIPSSYEITSEGRKLFGSAQIRRKGGVLQHGSLPLAGDITRICQALNLPDEEERAHAASHLRERATTIEQLLGKSVPWQDAVNAMLEGFNTALGIHFDQQEVSQEEMERAKWLCMEKYGQQEWIERL